VVPYKIEKLYPDPYQNGLDPELLTHITRQFSIITELTVFSIITELTVENGT
jgi:hypothetical protein